MAIKIHQLPDQVKGLLATLGCTSTVNGDRCSDYFAIAEDTETGGDLSVALIEERASLPQREWGYSMHVINDIKDTFCQIYHDDGNPGAPEEIVLAMLEKIIAAELDISIIPARAPTCREWDAMMGVIDGPQAHWEYMFSWCQDKDPDCAIFRVARGGTSPHRWRNRSATGRYVNVGFRPVFAYMDTDVPVPDGQLIAVGTLYMDGEPVRVPQDPDYDGDIADYIPGAKLEFRAALEDPAYQIQAIKVGGILIADSCLLRNISWEDIVAQGLCTKN